MRNKLPVDKTIRPLTTLTNLTPAAVTGGIAANQLGMLPLGYYKGGIAFWDLNLAVNEPNVVAEQKWMLGILSGREVGYDLVVVNAPVATPIATLLTGTITVPAGELWYVNAVVMNCPGDGALGAGFTMNWYCSLWTDRVGALGLGQPFHSPAHALANAIDVVNLLTTHVAAGGGAIQQLDEFGPNATAWGIFNKIPLLRLPAGTILTFTVLTDTAAVAVAAACTMAVFGAMGKVLVA